MPSRRFIEWSMEQPPVLNLPLLLNSASLVATNFAGASTTEPGSYNANVIRATLAPSTVVVCSTGVQNHVGTFRVWVRAYASSADVRLRLSWREGTGPMQANDLATPVASGNWVEMDLGVISVPGAAPGTGTQQWLGQFEALGDVGDTIAIDYVTLIPTSKGYGKALVSQAFDAIRSFASNDGFDQAAGNLNAKAAPVGGTWATSGSTTDLAVEATGHTLQRSTTSDTGNGRFALLGSTNFTDTLVQVDLKVSAVGGSNQLGVLARYHGGGSSELLRVSLNFLPPGGKVPAYVEVATSAGTQFQASPGFTPVPGAWYTLRAVVDSGGIYTVWLFPTGKTPVRVLTASGSQFAAAGLGASGLVGIYDYNPGATAVTRNFDNFIAAVPATDAVLYEGRQMEFRSDGAIRQDATGSGYGPVTVRGGNFTIPAAGAENRTTRIAVRSHRYNVEEVAAPNFMSGLDPDGLRVQVALTPRYLLPK